MAWTAPITWTTSQVVTAANLNQQVRDNETFLKTAHGCKLYSSSGTQATLTTATLTALPWNSEVWDSDGYHDNVTNNSRITIPSGLGGVYLAQAQIAWTGNATGRRYEYITKNGVGGTAVARQVDQPTNASAIVYQVSCLALLAAGDYLESAGQQDSGGGLATNGGTEDTSWFSVTLIGS